MPSPSYVLAFDFSLDRLDAVLVSPDGELLMPHQAYDNNWPGYQSLKRDVVGHLAAQPDAQLTAAGESTGLLWWHVYHQIVSDPDFEPYRPQLALLNPRQVKNFRKALAEEEKTDPKDALLVASFYRNVGVRSFTTLDWRYLPLRFFTRAYYRVNHSLAAEKARCLSLIYLKASEYDRLKPFSNSLGVTSQHVLTDCPDIAALADIPTDELADAIDAVVSAPLKDAQESAQRLQQVARDSYPFPPTLARAINPILELTLEHIQLLERHKAQYKRYICDELAGLPEADLALDYHGLGPILVGGILAEIQDPRRFVTGQKYDRKRKRMRPRNARDGQAGVAKMAGLWWPRGDSGRFTNQDRKLAHNRNPILRYWFVQSAYCLKRHQDEYADYYQRKFQEVKHHAHKRALILTARKAVRLIFALLLKGQRLRLGEGIGA
jgi:hypothetical protein